MAAEDEKRLLLKPTNRSPTCSGTSRAWELSLWKLRACHSTHDVPIRLMYSHHSQFFEKPLPQDPQNSHQCTWSQLGVTIALSPSLQGVITPHCSTQIQPHTVTPTGGSEQAEHSQNTLQSVLGAVPTVTALKTAHACENIFGCICLSPPHPF